MIRRSWVWHYGHCLTAFRNHEEVLDWACDYFHWLNHFLLHCHCSNQCWCLNTIIPNQTLLWIGSGKRSISFRRSLHHIKHLWFAIVEMDGVLQLAAGSALLSTFHHRSTSPFIYAYPAKMMAMFYKICHVLHTSWLPHGMNVSNLTFQLLSAS